MSKLTLKPSTSQDPTGLESPWICEICRKPISAGSGYVEIVNVSQEGDIGGYPQFVPEEAEEGQLMTEQRLQSRAADLAGAILSRKVLAAHHSDCDPWAQSPGYWIAIDEVVDNSLAEWTETVSHLQDKTWVTEVDVKEMHRYWFNNRSS